MSISNFTAKIPLGIIEGLFWTIGYQKKKVLDTLWEMCEAEGLGDSHVIDSIDVIDSGSLDFFAGPDIIVKASLVRGIGYTEKNKIKFFEEIDKIIEDNH